MFQWPCFCSTARKIVSKIIEPTGANQKIKKKTLKKISKFLEHFVELQNQVSDS